MIDYPVVRVTATNGAEFDAYEVLLPGGGTLHFDKALADFRPAQAEKMIEAEITAAVNSRLRC